jgi:bacterioferritin
MATMNASRHRADLDCDLQMEMSARAPYQEAATQGHSVKDYVTHDLFEVLMTMSRNTDYLFSKRGLADQQTG